MLEKSAKKHKIPEPQIVEESAEQEPEEPSPDKDKTKELAIKNSSKKSFEVEAGSNQSGNPTL